MRFEVQDLYELPRLGLDRFDVTLFNGIFYHLPEPLAALRVAADLTGDVMIVNTGSRIDLPDGLLAAFEESRTRAISGVYGLAWFPTGPQVLTQMLRYVGFPEVRSVWWEALERQAPRSRAAGGRCSALTRCPGCVRRGRGSRRAAPGDGAAHASAARRPRAGRRRRTVAAGRAPGGRSVHAPAVSRPSRTPAAPVPPTLRSPLRRRSGSRDSRSCAGMCGPLIRSWRSSRGSSRCIRWLRVAPPPHRVLRS